MQCISNICFKFKTLSNQCLFSMRVRRQRYTYDWDVFQVWQCGQCSAPCALFPTRVGLENHVERQHPFEGKTAFDCAKCASAR